MSAWFPEGRIHVRGWSAAACVELIRTRAGEVQAGDRPLLFIRNGRLVGRMRGTDRFSLRPRSSSTFGGAFTFHGRADDAGEGCVIRYTTRVELLCVAFWIGWLGAIAASASFSILHPDPSAFPLWGLAVIFVAYLALAYRTFIESRRSIHATRAELVAWLGSQVENVETW